MIKNIITLLIKSITNLCYLPSAWPSNPLSNSHCSLSTPNSGSSNIFPQMTDQTSYFTESSSWSPALLIFKLVFLSFFFNIYLFIWLRQVLLAAGGLLSCGMQVGSSSLTRDQTRVPCIGSTESYPLRHQGSPQTFLSLSISISLKW